ncbi:kea1 (nucleomorph) [Hemiselmis andersenii]|uniref:Kea1 n=1 Tax=Hemiselmis andersenii TaxID=464988 RepID=A9BK57_HEMAN|nr:kea1 [Hemiselmis andersenii]ABW97890.1 kea1 [Hemiselmis andersenii]|mmetsp:Transcript_20258/g.48966  ORF Transcript_20258/g.48966 Transcript_20258/m.48966 type:complete len:728 (+) Transcript_20258:1608-3791(+)
MKTFEKHFKQKILMSFFFNNYSFLTFKKLEIKKKVYKKPKNFFIHQKIRIFETKKSERKTFLPRSKHSIFIYSFTFYLIFFSPLNLALAANSSNSEFLNISNETELVKKKISHAVPIIVEKKILNKQTGSELAFVKKFIGLLKEMDHHVSRPTKDALILLLATVFVVPLMRKLNTSPILGFLSAGLVLGPNGFGLIHRIGASKTLAEFGVVFFLFEMGLELSLSRLKSLGLDVFGLGSLQWLLTGMILALISVITHAPIEAAVVIGFGIALSSSAFVLQLLSERGEVGTRFGRASFGILLFQDLAVVPLLVVVPLLAAGSGDIFSLLKALGTAATKAAIALGVIFLGGKTCLEPVFRFGASAKSPEAFVATILVTVLTMSTLTESLGLSDTLGAFLAGVLLAETKYRHQIEADIAPFRGLLLGLFFITVGFGIDISLMTGNFLIICFLLFTLLFIKTTIITALCRGFGINFSNSQRTGLILSQGGEFAFVTFGLAQKNNLLPPQLAQLLFLIVALSMVLTPFLASTGSKIGASIESKRGLIGARKEDVADAKDYVVVAGFGRVGQSVCDLLDARLVRYMAFDLSPVKVMEARNKGLPVFFGDACRPEVLKAAGIKNPKAVIVTLDDQNGANRAVNALRREYPNIQIFVRAKDAKHQKKLQLGGATAIVPELLESSLLLGGAVLLSYGTPIEEVNLLIEEARKKTLMDAGLDISGLTGYSLTKSDQKI